MAAAFSSQSALLHLHRTTSFSPSLALPFSGRASAAFRASPSNSLAFGSGACHGGRFGWGVVRAVAGSDSALEGVNLGGDGVEIGDGGDGDGGSNGGWGGGGGGGGEGEGKEEGNEEGKGAGLSMSQKLTLGYAALVGGMCF